MSDPAANPGPPPTTPAANSPATPAGDWPAGLPWRPCLTRLGWSAVGALAAGAGALALVFLLAPEPLRPPDPARAAEALAGYAHKRAVVLSLLWVPIAVLCAAAAAPWVSAPLTAEPAARRPASRTGWWNLLARSSAGLTIALVLALALALWDLDHPTLSAAAWRAIYGRFTFLLTLGCLTVVWLQFAADRAIQLLRRLRRWDATAAARATGLGTVLALSLYGLGLSTTFLSRPWIAGRVPSEALVEEHLARYTAALRAGQPTAADDPTRSAIFEAEARQRVRSTLRAALNAEAVNFTAEANPMLLGTAIWWFHDDGPAGRRVDLRTGAISYYQWVGSDSRITLPDFWKAAAKPDAADGPADADAASTDNPPRFDPTGGGAANTPADDINAADRTGPLAGIPIRTGLIGALAGYGGWNLGPLTLDKEDAAPLAIFLALAAALAAAALTATGQLLKL